MKIGRVLLRQFSDKERKRLASIGAAMPDGSYPISDVKDLEDAIRAIGRAKPGDRAAVKRHIISRAKSLGKSALIPDSWQTTEAAARTRPGVVACSFDIVTDAAGAAPEWIVLVPAGTFTLVDGRGPFNNSDPDAVVAETRAMMRGGLALDINHSTDRAAPMGLPAPAAGWIRELKVENGAICGRVEWNANGLKALADKEYRFLSPVLEFDRPAGADPDAPTGTITRIMRASLVNDPAITTLPALAASRKVQMPDDSEANGGEASIAKIVAGLEKLFPDMPKSQILKMAAQACGVSDDDNGDGGDGDAAMDAADGAADPYESAEQMSARHAAEMAGCTDEMSRQEMARKHTAEKTAMARRDHAAASRYSLARDAQQMTPAQLDAAVARHPMVVKLARDLGEMTAAARQKSAATLVAEAIKNFRLIPAQREWATAYCSADPAGFAKFVANQPVFRAGPDETFLAIPPADQMAGGITPDEAKICDAMRVSREAFIRRRDQNLALMSNLPRGARLKMVVEKRAERP